MVDCGTVKVVMDAMDAAYWCAECTTDLCNSTAGLSVGALSMVILGTVMQVLA